MAIRGSVLITVGSASESSLVRVKRSSGFMLSGFTAVIATLASVLPSGEIAGRLPNRKVFGATVRGTASAFPDPSNATRETWLAERFWKYTHFWSGEQMG